MPFLVIVYLFVIGYLALLAQMVLPVIFEAICPALNVVGCGSALIPMLVIYASMEVGEAAPLLAGALGLLLDLNSQHRLGTSPLILCSISVLIVTQAYKPESRLWIIRLTYVLVGTFVFMLLDYFFILVETARWYWTIDIWTKITFASLINVVLYPFFYFAVGIIPRALGWKSISQLHPRRYAR